jgi:glycosyltransferase involved in cell wall biosynthesis
MVANNSQLTPRRLQTKDNMETKLKILLLSSSPHPFIIELSKQLRNYGESTLCLYITKAFLKPTFIGNTLSFLVKFIAKNPKSVLHLLNVMFKTMYKFSSYSVAVKKYFVYLVFAALIYKLHSKHSFDLIHAFWSYPAGISAVLAKELINKPIIISVLGYDVEEYQLRDKFFNEIKFFKEISKLALEKADIVIAGTENHYFNLINRGINKQKLRFIPLGIDTIRFSPEVDGSLIRREKGIKNDDIVVGFGPRLMNLYGPEDFIKAAAIVSKTAPNTYFMLIGSGPLCHYLEKLSRIFNIRTVFAGNIPFQSMPYYYAALDIYCIPSYAGQGVSALEAMSSGKPVIGYNTGTIRITDGVDGFLVEKGNIEELAEKILLLIRNPTLRRNMGENARRKVVSQYDITTCARRILSTYYLLLGKPSFK